MKRNFSLLLGAAAVFGISFLPGNLQAADQDFARNFRSQVRHANDGKISAYSVLVPQKINPALPSDYKEVFIERVPQKFYQPGRIHVKTRAKCDNGKENLLQSATSLTAQLKSINAGEITAFADADYCKAYPNMAKAGFDRLYEIAVPAESDPLEICYELMNNPDVEYACPIYVRYADATVNDPQQAQQYTLEAMHMYSAWDYTHGSTEVKIAIVDSGTDWDHVDLAANIWKNPNETLDGIDNDGNGKVDDIHGWDFVGTTSAQELGSGIYREDNDPTNSYNTHGTSVAGCAGAATNNGVGIAGIGYNCKILPIKCGSSINGYSGIYRGYEGITYAINMGAQVINCSWGGGGYSSSEQEIVNYALSEGSLIVTSAGNSGTDNDAIPQYPASYSGMMSAGATVNGYDKASFSNYGYEVTVFAPGSKIYTTDDGDSYTTIDGTSFSSPNVAGVAGLVYSMHPTWTPKQVMHQIRSTCDHIDQYQEQYGDGVFGAVNALRAVEFNSVNGASMPGVETTGYTIDQSTSTIKDYGKHTVLCNLKNYLGAGKNFKVTAYSPDSYFNVNYTTTIGDFAADDSKQVQFEVQLSENCPWYTGKVRLVLRYEADEYFDYELIEIPISISNSESSFTTLYNTNSGTTNWYDISAPAANTCWIVGSYGLFGDYSGSMRAYNSDIEAGYITSSGVPNSVAAIDDMTAYVGSTTGRASSLNWTENAGNNWESSPTTSLTNCISYLFAFDNDALLMIGEPKEGRWGIAYGTAGSSSWKTPTMSAPNDGESITAACKLDSYVWFATDDGRVFRSTDYGHSWASSSIIKSSQTTNQPYAVKISFRTGSEGIAYIANPSTGQAQLALTTDGGETWSLKPLYFSNDEAHPVYVYGVSSAKSYNYVRSDGAVFTSTDDCVTWRPILSSRTNVCDMATHYDNGNGKVTIYMVGAVFCKLQYNYSAFDAKPVITVAASALDFETVTVGASKVKTLKITNSGNAVASMDISIVPGDGTVADEFDFVTDPKTSLAASESSTMRLKFIPESAGAKSATLKIAYHSLNDQTATTVDIPLTGNADEPPSTLAIVDTTALRFGSVDINTTEQKNFVVENLGSQELQITAITLTPLDATEEGTFTITNSLPIAIGKGETLPLTVEFAPKSAGSKLATISLENTGDNSPLVITASGNGNEPGEDGVRDEDAQKSFSIYPNPTSGSSILTLRDGFRGGETIEIYDESGSRVSAQKIDAASNNILLDTSSLSSGSYTVVLIQNGKRESINVIVNK